MLVSKEEYSGYGLPEKELIKSNKELVELHKRVILTYLVQKNLKYSARKKFFAIYDYYIDEDNIRLYYFRPIRVFVHALITDRLDEIADILH